VADGRVRRTEYASRLAAAKDMADKETLLTENISV